MVSSYPTPKRQGGSNPSQTFKRGMRRLPANDPRPRDPGKLRRGFAGYSKHARRVLGNHPLMRTTRLAYDAYDLFANLNAKHPDNYHLSPEWTIKSKCGPWEAMGRASQTDTNCGTIIPYVNAEQWERDLGQLQKISSYSSNLYVARFFNNIQYQPTDPATYRLTRAGYAELRTSKSAPAPVLNASPRMRFSENFDTGALGSIDPHSFPPGSHIKTSPIPWLAIPARSVNPWRSPTEQTRRGYATAPRLNSNEVPSSNFEIRTFPGRKPRPVHRLARPPKFDRESKVKVSGAYLAVDKVLNNIGEMVDFLEVLHDALPAENRVRGHSTPQEKLVAVVENWDKINVSQAVMGFIENQIEDRIFGQIGKANAEVSSRLFSSRNQGILGATSGYQMRGIHWDASNQLENEGN